MRATFDCRPGALIKELNLLRPIYQKTSNYGHFGRADADFYWERTNKADALKAAVRKTQSVGRRAVNGNGNGTARTAAPSRPPAAASRSAAASAAPSKRKASRGYAAQLVLDEVHLLKLRRAFGRGEDADLALRHHVVEREHHLAARREALEPDGLGQRRQRQRALRAQRGFQGGRQRLVLLLLPPRREVSAQPGRHANPNHRRGVHGASIAAGYKTRI